MRRHRRLRRLPRRLPRDASREGALRTFSREYPFGWLGILAAVAPSSDELIYAHHERGFALHSLRSPELSRLYVQCRPDEDIGEWPDERIWEELQLAARPRRLDAGRGPGPREGRHAACAASSSSRCATGASSWPATPRTSCRRRARRGSTSRSRTCAILAEALASWHATGSHDAARRLLGDLPAARLARRALLVVDDVDAAPLARRRPVRAASCSSRSCATSSPRSAAATMLAENYVGLERV